MKKRLLIAFILLFSSHIRLFSCSYYPFGEDIRFSLFSSNLANENDLNSLFYSANFLNYYSQNELSGPQENLNEWYVFFDGKFERDVIDEVIYRSNYLTYSSYLKDNELYRYLIANSDSETGMYLLFAKKTEHILLTDTWSDEEIDQAEAELALTYALAASKNATNELLKLRYAYQGIVLAYYLKKNDTVNLIYDDYIVPLNSNSVIASWALFYKASINENSLERYLTYAVIFEKSRAKNEFIFKAFPSDIEEQNEVLSLAKTDEEKAAVLSLMAFKNPTRAIDQLDEIVKLNPSSSLLDILLVREINKMEDWFYTDRYTGFGTGIDFRWWEEKSEEFRFLDETNFESDKRYLKKVFKTTEELLHKNVIENKSLWNLSLTYMAYMLEDKTEFNKQIALIEQDSLDRVQLGELKTIEILGLVRFEHEWKKSFQDQLFQSLRGLDKFKTDLYNYDRFRGQLMMAISRKYLEKGEVGLAALFEAQVDGGTSEEYEDWDSKAYQCFNLLNENANSDDMDAFFELWNNPEKSELEAFLFADLEPFRWRLTDLWGTTYFREDKLEKALEIYETIPAYVWYTTDYDLHYRYADMLDCNPFETRFSHNYHDEDKTHTYTKPAFIKEILRLKYAVKHSAKGRSYNYVLLGNAYFNMSEGGNAWYMTEYRWGSGSHSGSSNTNPDYFTADRALNYYKLAEKSSRDKAFAAFCYRLQYKCLQSKCAYLEDSRLLDNFMENMKDKYPKYAEELYDCDYFEYYFERRKKA